MLLEILEMQYYSDQSETNNIAYVYLERMSVLSTFGFPRRREHM